jgi:tryptophan halogenase
MKTNKILIVGGGSAGWMTAATLIKFYPKKDITLIESPTVPTIGVGESTLGHINNWLQALEIKDEEFMKASDATYKYSIRFVDFESIGCEPHHYPFGNVYLEGCSNLGVMDWHIKKAIYPETPLQDYARTFMPQMALVDKNKINTNSSGIFNTFRFDKDTAYHFDALKFAGWLKDSYAKPKGVKHIQDTVTNVNTDSNGVTSITTENSGDLTADLYIDCTGFKSMLLGEALEEPYEPYAHTLTNNKAWACQVPYIDIEKEMQCFTNCTALGNGWVWNTPVWSRLGTGYVYSDKYISSEDALEEFKNYLCSNKMLIPRTKEQVESYKFREVSFKSGIYKRTWVKNVCAIGLSAGFLEPLESNGLFSIHEFLLKMMSILQRGKVSQWDRDVYNTTTRNQFDNFAEFVGLHYALSHRDDTEYWKDISNKTFDQSMVNLEVSRKVGYFDLANQHMFDWTFAPRGGIHFVATGLNFLPVDKMRVDIMEFLHKRDFKGMIDEINKVWERNKRMWDASADTSPTHYEYLKNTIYKE